MKLFLLGFLPLVYVCLGTPTPKAVTTAPHVVTKDHAATTHAPINHKTTTHHNIVHVKTTAKHQHGHHTPHHRTPRPTYEPNEHELFTFRYDPIIHIMVGLISKNRHKTCFVYKMSRTEQSNVYTPTGLRTVEFNVLEHIMANKSQPYPYDDLSVRSYALGNACRNGTIYRLNYIP